MAEPPVAAHCCKCGRQELPERLKGCRRTKWPTVPDREQWQGLEGRSYHEAVRAEKRARLEAPVQPPCTSTAQVCLRCIEPQGCFACQRWECDACAADQETPVVYEEYHENVNPDGHLEEDCYGRKGKAAHRRLLLRKCTSCSRTACDCCYDECDDCDTVLCGDCQRLFPFRRTWCEGCRLVIEGNDQFDIGPVDWSEGVCFQCWNGRVYLCGCGEPSLDPARRLEAGMPAAKRPKKDGTTTNLDSSRMVFTASVFRPSRPWVHAKPKFHRGKPLVSADTYHRFEILGQCPQYIAVREQTKPLQVTTVLNHLFQCLEQGRPLNLERLAMFVAPPTRGEWGQLQEAERTTGLDVTAAGSFPMKAFLQPILGSLCATDRGSNRSTADQETLSQWYKHVRWYQALRRTGYVPTFEPAVEEVKPEEVISACNEH